MPPTKSFRFSGLVGGLYAAANVFDQPQGTVPRLSNMVFTERGGLLTTDGTHVVSRPVPPPPPAGFISSGAVSSSQPPAPGLRSTATTGSGGLDPAEGIPLSVDVATPSSLQAGDVLIAIVLNQRQPTFGTPPAVSPPSSDWKVGAVGASIGSIQVSVFALTVAGALPSTLTFTAQAQAGATHAAMMVVVVPLDGANGANPVDQIGISFVSKGSNGAGPDQLEIPGITTLFTNDRILLAAGPTLGGGAGVWGGVITPGIPAGTTQVALIQDVSFGQTFAVWTQAFVGPGPTGNYLSPSGWSAQTGISDAECVIAIAAGYPYDGDVEGFEPTDNGAITPSPIITGASTLLSAPLGLFFDSQKRLWIADAQSGNQGGIFMYRTPSQDASGANPDNVIQGSNAALSFPQDVFLDGTGNIYVANLGTNTQAGFISIFAAGSSGNVPPLRVISGPNTTLVSPVGVAVDANGNIYVIDSTQNAVIVFPPNESGNIFPSKVIKGSNTLLFDPTAIRFDSAGNLWVAVGKVLAQNNAYLVVFAPGVSGNAIPLNQVTSAALQPVSGGGGPTGLSFDSSGNIFVAVYKNAEVLKFNVGSTGASTPSATITGWSNGPWGIAIPH